MNVALSSPQNGGAHARASSPRPGRSTFTTSAPISPRICVQKGPATFCVRSTTRTPSSGSATAVESTTGLSGLEATPGDRGGCTRPIASPRELAWTTSTSTRRAEVLEAVAETAARMAPDGFALVWLKSGERLLLRAAAGRLRHAHGGLRTEFSLGQGLIGASALASDIVVVDDPAADTRAHEAPFLRAEGVRRFVGRSEERRGG